MKEPKLVAARCVERMSYSVDAVSSRVAISVKHGLGVHSMASYINVQDDRQQEMNVTNSVASSLWEALSLNSMSIHV